MSRRSLFLVLSLSALTRARAQTQAGASSLKAGVKYPETLIWTTTKDDRVGPQHARRFAAKMSAMGLPYFFFEVTEGGHGAGANLREQAHTSAMEYVYFARKLNELNGETDELRPSA
jgi:prolyl oligopeptidase